MLIGSSVKFAVALPKRDSTEYASFRLVYAWQSVLNKSRFFVTTLMDLQKACNYVLVDLFISKLEACGMDKKVSELLFNCFSLKKQGTMHLQNGNL